MGFNSGFKGLKEIKEKKKVFKYLSAKGDGDWLAVFSIIAHYTRISTR